MKPLIFFMLLLLPIISFGQKTKKKSFNYKRSKILKEEYYVLKHNKSVKHGSYKFYYSNGQLKEIGNYKNGLKDGKWIVYRNRGDVDEVQFYRLGEKTGIWEKHIENGKIIKRYDHIEKKPLKSRFFIQLDYPETARENEIEGTVRSAILNLNIIPIMSASG
jgi:antitoxin component YwqK of YwqJK toxin-antitoxin module